MNLSENENKENLRDSSSNELMLSSNNRDKLSMESNKILNHPIFPLKDH